VGKIVLICRLARRDLRQRRSEALLLVLALVAATSTLTLGLVLHGETAQPYQQTLAATHGPDVTASVVPVGRGPVPARDLADLSALSHAHDVTGHSGPYPVTWAVLRAHGVTAGAEAEGRDLRPASIEQPKLVQGTWVRPGAAVVERTFADALNVHVGSRVTLNGRSFRVAGIAVTAAFVPYPQTCFTNCNLNTPQLSPTSPGLIWLTGTDARTLATPSEPLAYYLNLRLASPAGAEAFASGYDDRYANDPTAPELVAWQDISGQEGKMLLNEQRVMLVASWLLGLLAIGSAAVLVGGRMADQTRRIGLLKAVGGTPKLVAAVLLAEYLFLAVCAAAAGLAVGRLVAPLLASPGAGMLGTAGTPPLTPATAAIVVGVALLLAGLATFVPALRAARTSTVSALDGAARSSRRRGWVIAVSARLPVPLLLGLRLAARRPRRVVVGVFSIAVTVSGLVAVLLARARYYSQVLGTSSGLGNPRTDRLNELLLMLTIMLVTLAAVNAVFIAWATALDTSHSSALARALGATPGQVTAGLIAAQLLPALAGAVLGLPGGIGLFAAVRHGDTMTYPPIWSLIAVVPGTLLVLAALTAIPARAGARRSVSEILQSEAA
jgi:ABC-type lipoprotein release transport system permease subunit